MSKLFLLIDSGVVINPDNVCYVLITQEHKPLLKFYFNGDVTYSEPFDTFNEADKMLDAYVDHCDKLCN